ncbi:MAG: NUDIX domain-containing protein [Planctomyces sp.]|jgi:ADP-ribose pyrophosphatase YjhB (NUDIX family)
MELSGNQDAKKCRADAAESPVTPAGRALAQRFELRLPSDDNRERMTCLDCGWVHYENPRIIVTAVVRHGERLLLCRRAIRPRYGFWTFPGGFMENHETPEEGACREVREESGAEVVIRQLMGVYSIPRIGQVHLVYLADMVTPHYSPGTESLDVQLYDPVESRLPWDDLAFPVNHWVLRDYLSLRGGEVHRPFSTRPDDLQQRMSRVDHHPDFPPPDHLRCDL